MIELERHIEILLLNNDCVIVPGLGGFMAHHVEAHYDESDGMFIPPLRTLGFNPQLTMNDSLLVQSYIEAYDISYPEALRRIEDEVTELRQHLDTEGIYELNDLGTIRMNVEGKLEFNPCEAGILTPSLYGLSSFELSPFVGKGHATFISNIKEKPVTDEPAPETIADESAEVVQDDRQEEETAIVIKMSWLRNAAAIAAAVIAFFIIQTPVSNGIMQIPEVQQSSVMPVTQKDTNKQLPVVEKLNDADKATQPQAEESQPTQEKETVIETAKETKPSYCIVLASQTTRHHADTFVGRLKADGYNEVSIMEMTTGKVRVVYGSFDDEDAATNQLRLLRQKDNIFAEAWVLKLPHQKM